MDQIGSDESLDADVIRSDAYSAVPQQEGPQAAGEEATTPLLHLDGFQGPLDHLLTLARAARIDLAALSLTAVLDQLAVALRQATVPLGQKADWVVMAAWLLQLRARLLLPVEAAQQEAEVEAEELRGRLLAWRRRRRSLPGWSSGHSSGATFFPVAGRRYSASRARRRRCSMRWNSSGPAWRCSTTGSPIRIPQAYIDRCAWIYILSPRHRTGFCGGWR